MNHPTQTDEEWLEEDNIFYRMGGGCDYVNDPQGNILVVMLINYLEGGDTPIEVILDYIKENK